MADLLYTSAKRDLGNGSIDWDTDTINIMLVTSAYVPSAAHAKRSDITNEVAAGGGYTAGGQTLAGRAVGISGTTAQYTATSPTWSSSTISAAGAVVYKSRGGVASADELVCYLDFGGTKSSSNGPFTINFNAAGVFNIA